MFKTYFRKAKINSFRNNFETSDFSEGHIERPTVNSEQKVLRELNLIEFNFCWEESEGYYSADVLSERTIPIVLM